jgi:hypothetical protein
MGSAEGQTRGCSMSGIGVSDEGLAVGAFVADTGDLDEIGLNLFVGQVEV